MLNSLKIENFKNIKSINIPELARVNLITGSNNTSKTTLLEAIGLLASNMDFNWIYSILSERGELFFNENESSKTVNNFKSIRSFFHNREINFNKKNSIFIGNKEEFIRLGFVYYIDSIEKVEDNGKIVGKRLVRHTVLENDNSEDRTLGLAVSYKDGDKIVPLSGSGYSTDPRMQWATSFEPKIKFQFIKPSFKENRLNGSLWDKIALSEKEDYVIETLRIIEKDLDKIAFIKEETASDERRVTAKVRGNAERVPLQSMGDGINRVLSIALGLVNAEGGYLLIDEFENGLHHSIQEKLWEVIFKIATELNIQVFATTHSNDCVSAFSNVTNSEKYAGMGKLIRFERKDNTIKVIDFESNELKIANENNIELR
ncbi:MAG: hypothetical protein RLZZ292_215 [Bacteroidota bacterium]|jgi:AAA15 family ATPase/GTPase